MNTEHLRYLLTIADCQSINKASEQLLLKQQYLSSIVKALEKQFDTVIFKRHSRGIILTDDGQYLIDRIRQILLQIDTLHFDYLYPSKQTCSDDSGDIHFYSIPQSSSHILLNVIHDFRQHFPKANVSITEKATDEIHDLVLNDPAALGIITINEPFKHYQARLPAQLKALHLRVPTMVALIAKLQSIKRSPVMIS